MNQLKLPLLMLFLTALLWSSAFVGIRIGLSDYSPGALALFRFAVASFCMLLIYPYVGGKIRMKWSHRAELILLGMLGIGVYNLALNFGEQTVSAGVASFIIGLMPVITLILSLVFLAEKASLKMIAGVFMSISGLLLLALEETSHGCSKSGMALIFLSTMSGAVYTILLKKYLKIYHPVVVSAWCMWGGTMLLMIFLKDLLIQINGAGVEATLAAIYLGIFPAAIAYMCWSYVLNFMQASKASTGLYIIPVFSTVMGYLVLKEQPTALVLVGGVIALFGALLASVARNNQGLNSVDKKKEKHVAME